MEEGKLVAYYSFFNLQTNAAIEDFSHLQPFLTVVRELLHSEFIVALKSQMEYLNVKSAKYSLELLVEVWFKVILNSLMTYEAFKQELILELGLDKIWQEGNSEMRDLEDLVIMFFNAALQASQTCPVAPTMPLFKLLPSAQHAVLQPLIVATEREQTFAERIYKVLERVSVPLESLMGVHITTAIYSCVRSLSQGLQSTIKVTKDFATNTVEFDHSGQNMRIRVIQPAKEFYDQAIDSWLDQGQSSSLAYYVNSIRQNFGSSWTESLVKPAELFYSIASEEWSRSGEFGVEIFLMRLQTRLFESWQQSVVECSRSFQLHKLPKA
jgi:hypothetical protein